MKAHIFSLPLAAALMALGAGCGTDYSRTQRGAAGGAAAGAVIGGVVGSNSSRVSTEEGAAIGAVAGGLAGAAIGRHQDQQAQAATPVNSAADTGYTVQTIPPAPVSEPQETIPPQPNPNAVWIRGHYTYTGNGYQWQAGHWEVPPAGTSTWIGPSWQPAAGGGYVYVRGHWQ